MACLPCAFLMGLSESSGNFQFDELYSYYMKLLGVIKKMPAGNVRNSYSDALNEIGVQLNQAQGKQNTSTIFPNGRPADWDANPALWDREYKEMKYQLQQMERGMAEQMNVMTTIPDVPKQPIVTSVVKPDGSGKNYIPQPTPASIIGPTGRLDPIKPTVVKKNDAAKIGIAIAVIAGLGFLLWRRK